MRFRNRLFPADVDLVASLAEAAGAFSPAEVAVARELAADALERGEASGYRFVLPAGDAVHGFACFGPDACAEGSFHLYWVVVAPDAQGRGLGASLVAETLARIKGEGGRALYAETSGTPAYAGARTFYERLGFTPAARLADFYRPGDDKIIYVKQLQGETRCVRCNKTPAAATPCAAW